MDNQKLQKIESLYQFLIDNPKTTRDKILDNLGLSNDTILQCITELNKMGLQILIQSKHIELQDSIDVIDPIYIGHQIKSLGINKKIHYQFKTQSTNQLAQVNNYDAIYLCNYQSQGKGRQAKKWITPLGQSIALSISHNFKFGLQMLSGLNIAIGVAIIKALNKFGNNNIGLKWPNDILDPHGKVAGILIEASGSTSDSKAIIGIGINWNIRQELFNKIEQPCSNAGISSIPRNQFIVELIKCVYELIYEFTQNNLKNIQPRWKKNDVYLDKKINIIQGTSIKQAIYKGINENGLLKVEVDNQKKLIASGEVSIRSANESSSTK